MSETQGLGVRIRRKTHVLEKRILYLKSLSKDENIKPSKILFFNAEISALEFAVETIKQVHFKYFGINTLVHH